MLGILRKELKLTVVEVSASCNVVTPLAFAKGGGGVSSETGFVA
jgi:hypothetical protein